MATTDATVANSNKIINSNGKNYIVNAQGGYGGELPSNDQEQASASTGSPALIVTSNASRSNYANNINTINDGTSNLTQPAYGDEITDTSGNKGIAKFNSNTGKPLDNSGTDTTTDDTKEDPSLSGIDPDLKAQYDSAVSGLDEGIASAKANLESARATLQNDPAASAAVDQIMAKFEQQIQLMKAKNLVLLGSYKANAARSGSLQYANEMSTDFLSEEQDKATQRVTDLIGQETSAVLKAQQAYKTGDVAAFDKATKDYKDANKSKVDALDKLLKESNEAVKNHQAEIKSAKASVIAQSNSDIKTSTAIAKTVADSIAESGVDIDTAVQEMATKAGITNTDVLKSAVLKAQQDNAKTDLAAKNTASIIAKRNQPKGTSGTKKYANFSKAPTASAVTKVNAYIQSIGGNQAAIDAANNDETTFYKIYNSVSQ